MDRIHPTRNSAPPQSVTGTISGASITTGTASAPAWLHALIAELQRTTLADIDNMPAGPVRNLLRDGVMPTGIEDAARVMHWLARIEPDALPRFMEHHHNAAIVLHGMPALPARTLATLLAAIVPGAWLTVMNLAGHPLGAQAIQILTGKLPFLPNLTLLKLGSRDTVTRFAAGQLTAFAHALGGLHQLTVLHLEGTALGSEGMCILAPALADLPGLTDLTLSEQDLCANAGNVLAALLKAPLIRIDLSGNRLESAGAMRVLTAAQGHASLSALDLRGNGLDANSGTAIANLLANNTVLLDLHLDSNALGDAGAEQVASALETNATLRVLSLAKNDLDTTGITGIAGCLADNRTLTHLDLGRNRLRTGAAEVLATALCVNTSLTHLELKFIKADAAAIEPLLAFLPQNAALHYLGLGNVQLGDAGAGCLATHLGVNRGIRQLDLRNCGIGVPGMQALGAALSRTANVTCLAVGNAFVTDDWIAVLAAALTENNSIVELQIDSGLRPLSEAALCHFSQALQVNKRLLRLNINARPSPAVAAIKLGLRENRTLQRLSTPEMLQFTVGVGNAFVEELSRGLGFLIPGETGFRMLEPLRLAGDGPSLMNMAMLTTGTRAAADRAHGRQPS